MLVLTHCLPLQDLENRIQKNGETFPWLYKMMIKYINPVVIAILIGLGFINELLHPLNIPAGAQVLGIIMLLTPATTTAVLYFLNPWKENTLAKYRKQSQSYSKQDST